MRFLSIGRTLLRQQLQRSRRDLAMARSGLARLGSPAGIAQSIPMQLLQRNAGAGAGGQGAYTPLVESSGVNGIPDTTYLRGLWRYYMSRLDKWTMALFFFFAMAGLIMGIISMVHYASNTPHCTEVVYAENVHPNATCDMPGIHCCPTDEGYTGGIRMVSCCLSNSDDNVPGSANCTEGDTGYAVRTLCTKGTNGIGSCDEVSYMMPMNTSATCDAPGVDCCPAVAGYMAGLRTISCCAEPPPEPEPYPGNMTAEFPDPPCRTTSAGYTETVTCIPTPTLLLNLNELILEVP